MKLFMKYGEAYAGGYLELSLELQPCECDKNLSVEEILKTSKGGIYHKNSLFVTDEYQDQPVFSNNYGKYFKNGFAIDYDEQGKQVENFDSYGRTYFTSEQTQQILNALKDKDLPEVDTITSWFKTCVEKYNGFYILGI